MDVNRASMRPGSAHLTVNGLPGGPVDVVATEAMIQTVKSATLLHD